MTRPYSEIPADVRWEIGRKYELGRINRPKIICADHSISATQLLKCAEEYRAAEVAKKAKR